MSKICTDPLIQYGKKAIKDCKNNISSFELEQIKLIKAIKDTDKAGRNLKFK